ncbi:riboflavin biosynthesis protein [Niveomyces insectorum RCEF 264]|uniref:2,5-diamino-6-ribosylamino-4(3H)-pyrimidinone 5'-phosphate reductase n=1 Tax=Niveomyces insectorum RCEF 264 TaxID=1081102 RepID=A0A167NB77_9HYPO|nr:riboflavin biosynthesis protein [Niveomyces insectorum RCEF 264]
MADTLRFPTADAAALEPYLPPRSSGAPTRGRPFVTLTFATSLDSSLALAPGVRTALSGPQSKAMTHYLRSRHDAICVGVGTAVADDPGLNCRIAAGDGAGEALGDSSGSGSGSGNDRGVSSHQPRPIVIDPHDRWPLAYDSRVLATARRGRGLAPYVVTAVREPDAAKRQLLENHGGKYIVLDAAAVGSPGSSVAGSSGHSASVRFSWDDIFASVTEHGLHSIMVEGGGNIINALLTPANSGLVDSVIVTIAPTWLGRGGVVVSPERAYDANHQATAAARLTDVKWQQLGDDVVLCGRFNG